MRQTKTFRHSALRPALIAATLSMLLVSCSLMKDDRSDCPACRNPLHVKLRYDYNTQRANMFPDHVEEATVYVVDPETNTVVDMQTASNTAESQPLRDPVFAFNFEELPTGPYRLYAFARSAAEVPFGITVPDIADNIEKLKFTVPTSRPSGKGDVPVPANRLDTLWNTLQPVGVIVPEMEPVEATIPLMRLTNDLSVMVFRRDTPADNSHERYEIMVTDENLTLGSDNSPVAMSGLVYHPFAAWTTETETDNDIAERNAHYDLSLFRLIHHNVARHNPRLIIRNRETGHDIVNIDLCYYLALARNAYEIQNYDIQEYLDREYDYRLDFGIEGEGTEETWKYMTIRIDVLSWALRIQNEAL